MFNKKAQSSTMTMEELIKIILGFLILMMMISFLGIIYLIFVFQTPPMHESDFNRLVQDLNSFTTSSNYIILPIFSTDISFSTIYTDTPGKTGCSANTPCLCYEYGGDKDCKDLTIKIPKEKFSKLKEIKPGDNHLLMVSYDKEKGFDLSPVSS